MRNQSVVLLNSLCRANVAILSQKVSLLDTLVMKYGKEMAQDYFIKTCPIVQASIGQHIRHSMDHIEKAVSSAAARNNNDPTIHYDERIRGGTDENDLEQSKQRIQSVQNLLSSSSSSWSTIETVKACFYLTSNKEHESRLPSTTARELGFAAHHAIHHLAMVKIISLQTAGLTEEELPLDFGKAPSTVIFEHETTVFNNNN